MPIKVLSLLAGTSLSSGICQPLGWLSGYSPARPRPAPALACALNSCATCRQHHWGSITCWLPIGSAHQRPGRGLENGGERAGSFFPAPSLLKYHNLGTILHDHSSCWAAPLQFQIPWAPVTSSPCPLKPSRYIGFPLLLVLGCLMVPGQHL